MGDQEIATSTSPIGWLRMLDRVLAERLAGSVGRRPSRDLAMASAARHAAKLEVALLAVLFVGGPGPNGRRRRGAALRTAAALVLTVAAIEAVGRAIRRSRPFAARGTQPPLVPHEPGRSFPSRHAACAATMTTVVFPTAGRIGWLMGGLGTTLSLSRIYVGLHYPSDVLGGWLIGIATGLLVRDVGRPR